MTPVQVVASSNTFAGLVPGVSVTAKEVSSAPVSVTVAANRQSVVDAVQSFVNGYNDIRKFIKDNASYNVDNRRARSSVHGSNDPLDRRSTR